MSDKKPEEYRAAILAELALIKPATEAEQDTINAACLWVQSGKPLCRIKKPDVPRQHLVAYFVVHNRGRILLVAHRNAGLWLPTGGHVEPGEHPRDTARRELKEELGIDDIRPIGAPLLVSITETVGLTAGHCDVSLWYRVDIGDDVALVTDESEFTEVKWFPPEELPFDASDPFLRAYVDKQ